MPYEEFQRLIGKSGLSIKEFAALLDMNANSITNYKKNGKVPTTIAVIAIVISVPNISIEFPFNIKSLIRNQATCLRSSKLNYLVLADRQVLNKGVNGNLNLTPLGPNSDLTPNQSSLINRDSS